MKTRLLLLGFAALLFVCLVGAFISTPPARASTTITVNTTADVISDDGLCSLREAIRAANLDTASGATVGECPAGSGEDTIIVPAGTYSLTIAGAGEDAGLSGDLDITGTVTISGTVATNTVIDGGGLDRVLHILGGVVVQVSGVTIRHGGVAFSQGGGIANGANVCCVAQPVLILNRVTISNNGSNSSGGGIQNYGTLTITNGLIRDNVSGSNGGGIANSGKLAIETSEIMSNTTGSASIAGGGIASSGTLSLANTSVVSNTGAGVLNGSYGVATLADSSVSGNNGGGVINVDSRMTVTGSTISNNLGGGILNTISLSTASTITVTLSAIISNTKTSPYVGGAGVYNGLDGTMTISNSTISGNSAILDGGGVYNSYSGAMGGYANLYLYNVTITNNTADNGNGGGVQNGSGRVYFRNSLIAGNVDAGGNAADCSGTLTSQDYNLVQSATGCTVTGTATHNITGQNPNLGPLASNGGSTPTHALLPGSPAIDAGNNVTCAATDQRNVTRPQGVACDIGAFELEQVDLAVSKIDEPDPVVMGQSLTYTIIVANNSQSAATGVALTDTLPLSVTLSSAVSTQGNCSGMSTIVCGLGSLPGRTSITVTLVVTPTAMGGITNTVNVVGNEFDAQVDNNSASAETMVQSSVPVTGNPRVYLPLIMNNP